MNHTFWNDKIVFLTGHTGFKGGWLAHWLSELGATVHGYALAASADWNFYTETNLQKRLASSTIGDIRDLNLLTTVLKAVKPDIIIHMAAQPLVRESYITPVETFSTNVIGTVNLLEAARQVDTVKAIVSIASDKCYENKEWQWPYRENDHLGGHDPYSASKACAEIAVAAYRKSFLFDAGIHLASVRSGNVIGGGDWAFDRLVPDFLRATETGQTIRVRSPNAVRPWQHVLEALSGYMILAERLYSEGDVFAEAWNFGPDEKDMKSVDWIIKKLRSYFPGITPMIENTIQPHEAGLLRLDNTRAKAMLGWSPCWDLETALEKTIEWHQAWCNKEEMAMVTTRQIQFYQDARKKVGYDI